MKAHTSIFPLYDLKSRAPDMLVYADIKYKYINIQYDGNENLELSCYTFKKECPVYFLKTLFNNSHIVCAEFNQVSRDISAS